MLNALMAAYAYPFTRQSGDWLPPRRSRRLHLTKSIWLFLFLLPTTLSAQIITTLYGTAGGAIYDPQQLAFDKIGNLYIPTGLGNQILKFDTAGTLTVFAGVGGGGAYYGDNGPAISAKFNGPLSVVVDTFGNIYVTDAGNHRVRKIDTAGIITTVFGTGIAGFSGDGHHADSADLFSPKGLFLDKQGNFYITDNSAYRVRKVNSLGIISTIAGNGILGSTGDGGPATAAQCGAYLSICTDVVGNVYFTDGNNNTIRKIDLFGIISTVAGDTNGTYIDITDGVPAIGAPMTPVSIAFNENNELVLSDNFNNRIRVIDNAGIIHTIAGTGVMGSTGDSGPAIAAEISRPGGLAFDHCGNLFIAQVDHPRIRKISNPSTAPPSVSVVSATSDTLCNGWSEKYIATVAGGSAGIIYSWYVNGVLVSSGLSNEYLYTPAVGDSIYCVVSNGPPCAGNGISNVVHIVVISPSITLTGSASVAAGNIVTVNATIANAGSSYSINWYKNGILFNSTITPSVTYTKAPGTDMITATVISAYGGCNDSTTSAVHIVSTATTGNNVASVPSLTIYPNPANNRLNINNVTTQTGYTIYDVVGSAELCGILTNGSNDVSLAPLPAGIYLLEITGDEGRKIVKKIVKQ